MNEPEPIKLLKYVESFISRHPHAIKCPICGKAEFIKLFSINEYDFPGTIGFNCFNPECLFASNHNDSVSFAISCIEKLIGVFEGLKVKTNEISFMEGSGAKLIRNNEGKYRVNVEK